MERPFNFIIWCAFTLLAITIAIPAYSILGYAAYLLSTILNG